jgi:arsenate reductase-like glutaredoxin family protein
VKTAQTNAKSTTPKKMLLSKFCVAIGKHLSQLCNNSSRVFHSLGELKEKFAKMEIVDR